MRVRFQRRVDRFVGAPLCRLLSMLPRAWDEAKDAPPPRKILVILLSEMGSLVLAQPMFARLRKTYPEASLHALVFRKNKEVLDLLDVIPEGNIWTLRDDSLSHLMADALASIGALRRIGIDTVLDCELFSRVSAILSFLSGARRRVGFERHTQEGLYRGSFLNRPVLYNPYHHIARQFLTLVEAVDGSGRPLVKRSIAA
ncbi:MAG TPA: glycosyltransferase family 9 protein, partial [Vicinamibacteria bacterium]